MRARAVVRAITPAFYTRGIDFKPSIAEGWSADSVERVFDIRATGARSAAALTPSFRTYSIFLEGRAKAESHDKPPFSPLTMLEGHECAAIFSLVALSFRLKIHIGKDEADRRAAVSRSIFAFPRASSIISNSECLSARAVLDKRWLEVVEVMAARDFKMLCFRKAFRRLVTPRIGALNTARDCCPAKGRFKSAMLRSALRHEVANFAR